MALYFGEEQAKV